MLYLLLFIVEITVNKFDKERFWDEISDEEQVE